MPDQSDPPAPGTARPAKFSAVDPPGPTAVQTTNKFCPQPVIPSPEPRSAFGSSPKRNPSHSIPPQRPLPRTSSDFPVTSQARRRPQSTRRHPAAALHPHSLMSSRSWSPVTHSIPHHLPGFPSRTFLMPVAENKKPCPPFGKQGEKIRVRSLPACLLLLGPTGGNTLLGGSAFHAGMGHGTGKCLLHDNLAGTYPDPGEINRPRNARRHPGTGHRDRVLDWLPWHRTAPFVFKPARAGQRLS